MLYIISIEWFLSQALEAVTHLWPVTALLLIIIGVTATRAYRCRSFQRSLRYLILLAPLLLALCALLLAVFMAHRPDQSNKAPA